MDINLPSLAQHFLQSGNAGQDVMETRRRMIDGRQPEKAVDAKGLVYRLAFKGNVTSDTAIQESPLKMMRTAGICPDENLRLDLRKFHRLMRKEI